MAILPVPYLKSCRCCRFLRAFKLSKSKESSKLETFRQSLYQVAGGPTVKFDIFEQGFDLPEDHPFGKGSNVENIVCIFGHPADNLQTYENTFRPEVWGNCNQQEQPEYMEPLCGGHKNGEPCRNKLLKQGATFVIPSGTSSYRGRMQLIGDEYQSVVQAGSFRPPTASFGYKLLYTRQCAKCGASVGTQIELLVEGHLEEPEEAELVFVLGVAD